MGLGFQVIVVAKKMEFEMETVIMHNSELPTAPGDDWSWVIGERSCNTFQNASFNSRLLSVS